MPWGHRGGYDNVGRGKSTDGVEVGRRSQTSITGQNPTWVPTTWDLSSLRRQKIDFRFRYLTDGGLHYGGPFSGQHQDHQGL